MDEEQFRIEVEKLKKREPKEKFNWKTFWKHVYDLWLSTSAKMYISITKFADKMQERQAKNKQLEPLPQDNYHHKIVKNKPKKEKDIFEPTEDWGFDF